MIALAVQYLTLQHVFVSLIITLQLLANIYRNYRKCIGMTLSVGFTINFAPMKAVLGIGYMTLILTIQSFWGNVIPDKCGIVK